MKPEKIIKFQEKIHPLLLKLFSSKTSGEIILDGKLPEGGPFLIVANHLCIQDIPHLAQALKKHFYLLVSDEDKYNIDGLGLALNGVKWVHRTDKESRQKASEGILEILALGKDFVMYPEATWNLSPNLLMLPMNYGCIRIAIDASVPIVPVVTLFSDGERHTKIGEAFYPSDDLEKSIDLLRDKMATLFYEEIFEYYERNYLKNDKIYLDVINGEKYYYEKREDIIDGYWDQHVDKLYNQYSRARKDKSGVMEFESQFIFTPKSDDYAYFQVFNSLITTFGGDIKVKRISSCKNGYYEENFDKDHFGYGYNKHVLKKQLKK